MEGAMTTQKQDRRYLKDTGVAARYDVSRNTVWRWTREKKLPPPVKINGSTRWILDQLEEFEFEKE
jgi:prophage regulatory protein